MVLDTVYACRIPLDDVGIGIIEFWIPVFATVVLTGKLAYILRCEHDVRTGHERPPEAPGLMVKELIHIIGDIVGCDDLIAKQTPDILDDLHSGRGIGDHIQSHIGILEDPSVPMVVVPLIDIITEDRRIGILHSSFPQ